MRSQAKARRPCCQYRVTGHGSDGRDSSRTSISREVENPRGRTPRLRETGSTNNLLREDSDDSTNTPRGHLPSERARAWLLQDVGRERQVLHDTSSSPLEEARHSFAAPTSSHSQRARPPRVKQPGGGSTHSRRYTTSPMAPSSLILFTGEPSLNQTNGGVPSAYPRLHD